MKKFIQLPLAVLATFVTGVASGQESVEARLNALADQNQKLSQQVQAQQQLIEQLRGELTAVRGAGEQQAQALRGLEGRVDSRDDGAPPAASSGREHEIHVSGQTGVAFFKTGSGGQFPNGEFRVDDAKIFLEAPAMRNVYVFAGLDIQTREASDENLHLGEWYVDFENVSGALGGRDRLVNVRAGRFDIPFGEEYQRRSPVDNPLISHSAADIWGLDEGVELYGELGRAHYVLAVQNGGIPSLHDFTSDKSVALRLGYDPARWLHVSASGLRTGDVSVKNDALSAVWFGNGFFRALGAPATTNNFWANLAEVDAAAHWQGGALRADAGEVKFDDDDTTRRNARRLHYYSLEATQDVASGLFASARLSEIRAPRGYPLTGWGNFGTYFFASPLTTYLRRVSLGLGYRLSRPVVLKAEYAFESGQLTTGADRDYENLLSTELALQF